MSMDCAGEFRRGQSPRKTSTKHPFIGIEHRVIDSAAFADLKHSSVRVLLSVARQLTKDNNGHLQCSFAWCKRYGIGSANTLADSISDLIAHGFICRTKSHGANGVWATYAVTWLQAKNAILEASLKQADDEAARISKELQICSSFITCARVTVESENSFEGCDASVLLLDVQNRLDKAAGDLSHHGEVA